MSDTPFWLGIYEGLTGDDSWKADGLRANQIMNEMQLVASAVSPKAAADVIEWWGCWNSRQHLMGFVKAVRNRARNKK